MTDLEIDKALALAIGWEPEDVNVVHGCVSITTYKDGNWKSTRSFSHKDWNVIGPIAAQRNMFPYRVGHKWWNVAGYGCPVVDTPQTAIALAVIQGAET